MILKNLVEEASVKSGEGKVIANEMINGYAIVNEKITETKNIIDEVASVSTKLESWNDDK